MRSFVMKYLMPVFILSLLGALAAVPDGAFADETPPAAAKDTAEAIPIAAVKQEEAAKQENQENKEFEPPPGFTTKKRGKLVLYCMRDATIGTRFKTEKCYDEAQIRDYVLAREQNNRDFDRTRAICSNSAMCAP